MEQKSTTATIEDRSFFRNTITEDEIVTMVTQLEGEKPLPLVASTSTSVEDSVSIADKFAAYKLERKRKKEEKEARAKDGNSADVRKVSKLSQ